MDKMHDKENNHGSLIKAFVKMMSVHGAFDEEKNSKSGSISPPASQSSRALLKDTNVKFIANSSILFEYFFKCLSYRYNSFCLKTFIRKLRCRAR